jgi:glutathione S-transferase
MPYKLVYFYVRGRAQALRYLVADNDIPMEEQNVEFKDWAAMKGTTIFGQLPMFHDGDFAVAQSNAILRYVARKHGLYGKNEKEQAQIDMLNDQQEDVRLTYLRLIYQQYDTEKDNYIKTIPEKLATIEKFLASNNGGNGFFVGDKVNFVDYNVFDLLDNLVTLSPTCLDTLPKLKAFHQRMAAREKIAAYRAKDYFKKMPINGNGKQ